MLTRTDMSIRFTNPDFLKGCDFMKKYITPEFEKIKYQSQDVILSSDPLDDGETNMDDIIVH